MRRVWSHAAAIAAAWVLCGAAPDGGTQDADAPAPGTDGATAAAAAATSVEVTPAQVRLGERFDLVIRLRAPDGARYELPPSLDLAPFSEIARRREQAEESGAPLTVWRLTLATYEDVGELTVPGFELVAAVPDGKAAPAPIAVPESKVQVLSMLSGVDKPEPRDIAAPVAVLVHDYRLLVALGLILLWLLGAAWLRYLPGALASGVRLEELPPDRPAQEIALEKLQAIMQDDLLRAGRVQEYFVRISETVREYLGNRYGFFALDLTTRELLIELRDRKTPGLEHGKLETLLTEADLVKFARVLPTDDMSSRALNGAYALVESTRLEPLVREVA